jgi:hypothetical protein
MKINFITPGTIFGRRQASGWFYVLKKKRLEKQSVDFLDLRNSRRVENKDRFKKINVLENEIL